MLKYIESAGVRTPDELASVLVEVVRNGEVLSSETVEFVFEEYWCNGPDHAKCNERKNYSASQTMLIPVPVYELPEVDTQGGPCAATPQFLEKKDSIGDCLDADELGAVDSDLIVETLSVGYYLGDMDIHEWPDFQFSAENFAAWLLITGDDAWNNLLLGIREDYYPDVHEMEVDFSTEVVMIVGTRFLCEAYSSEATRQFSATSYRLEDGSVYLDTNIDVVCERCIADGQEYRNDVHYALKLRTTSDVKACLR